jgi:hypothetical protein
MRSHKLTLYLIEAVNQIYASYVNSLMHGAIKSSSRVLPLGQTKTSSKISEKQTVSYLLYLLAMLYLYKLVNTTTKES